VSNRYIIIVEGTFRVSTRCANYQTCSNFKCYVTEFSSELSVCWKFNVSDTSRVVSPEISSGKFPENLGQFLFTENFGKLQW